MQRISVWGFFFFFLIKAVKIGICKEKQSVSVRHPNSSIKLLLPQNIPLSHEIRAKNLPQTTLTKIVLIYLCHTKFVPKICHRQHWQKLFCFSNDIASLCSDITNTRVGISGETGHGGTNLHVYWMNSAATCTKVVQIYSWCVTPHSSPTRGGWPQPINYILNIFIFNYYIH